MGVLLLSHNTPDGIVSAARERGFDIVIMPPMADLPEPVASHPDMLLFCGWDKLFVRAVHMENVAFAAAVEKITSLLPNLSLTVTSDGASAEYPGDVAFNCAVFGGALFGRADAVSPAVKRCAAEHMTPTLNVAQGYTKCSTAILGGERSSAVITADTRICRAAQSRGIGAYLIAPGHIALEGYDTGFFGGASFFADGALFTLGDFAAHPSADIIRSAAAKSGVTLSALSSLPLFDAGCLYIEEKN